MYWSIFSSAWMSSFFFSLGSRSLDCRWNSSSADELNTHDCVTCFRCRLIVWDRLRARVILEMHLWTAIPSLTRMHPIWYLSSERFNWWDVAWVWNVAWSSAFLICEATGGKDINGSRLRFGSDFRLQTFKFSLKNPDDQSSPSYELLLLVVLIANFI